MTFFDDKAYTINDLIAAVIAIEEALGPYPFGPYASVRTRLDILESRINNPNVPAPNVNNPFYIGGSPISGVSIQDGYGDPTITLPFAISGSLFLREDGTANQGLYVFRPDGYWHQLGSRRRYVTSVTGTYTIQLTDDYLAITALTSPFSILLPTSPSIGDNYQVKDTTGNAGSYTVTINGNGTNIDGASTYLLNANYAFATFTFTGTQWSKT